MINTGITSADSSRLRRAARLSWWSGGALAAMMVCGGCGGATAEPLEEEQGIGQTEQALEGSVLDSVYVDGSRFGIGLSNIAGYNHPFYNLRYGILGSQLSTVNTLASPLYIDGVSAGAPYTFSARVCDGYRWGYGGPCSAWSAPYTAILPYPGSTWAYSSAVDDGVLAGAWGAGYYIADGVNVALPICSALADGAQYLGYWYNGACGVAYGGALHTFPNAQVLLTVPASAHWAAYGYGMLPHKAMIGGYYAGRSLYACRTLVQGAYIPGWTYGDGCTSCWGDGCSVVPASASEILCF